MAALTPWERYAVRCVALYEPDLTIPERRALARIAATEEDE